MQQASAPTTRRYPEVFDDVHRLIFQWLDAGLADGLRIDHPDGLYDPRQYLDRLQARWRGDLDKPPLNPLEIKDVSLTIQSKLRAYEIPDWQFLRTEFDKTYVTASFDNNGKAVTLNFIAVKEPDGWVISDIESTHDSLRLFLAQFKR